MWSLKGVGSVHSGSDGGSSGFTITEVLIVLAVTSLLFVSTAVAINGQQASTQFSQGMRDIESKIRDVINDTATGYVPSNNQNYLCQVIGGVPRITAGSGSGLGTNDQCVVLGRAVQVSTTADANKVYIYTVIGRRTMPVAVGLSASVPVASLADANPVAAIDGVDLTETYDLRGGMRVLSARTITRADSGMAGFFANFTNTTSGSTSDDGRVSALELPVSSNSTYQSTAVTNCLEFQSPCDNIAALNLGEWSICFQRSDERQTARLIVGDATLKSPTTVRVEFEDCT